MKKCMLTVSAAGAALLASATPTVTDITFDQDSSRLVTIGYTIDEPAVVTVDVQTNRGDGVFVSIGAENTREMTGAVNRLVTNTETANTVNWRPDLYWNQGNKIRGNNVKAVVTAWATNAPPDWMAIDLATKDVRYYVSTNAMPFAITDDRCKTDTLVMRRIHATDIEWRMGSPTTETGRGDGEQARTVWLTSDYYIGVYTFTIGQYKTLYPKGTLFSGDVKKPCNGGNANYSKLRGAVNWPNETPMHKVASGSLIDSIRNSLAFEFDLPTEAQWEFACRAGTRGGYNDGSECETTEGGTAKSANLSRLGWYPGDDGTLHEVGLRLPNAWNLYDMHGNVLECCLDLIDKSVDMSTHGGADPVGLASVATEKRVQKGGGYTNYPPKNCRSAFREGTEPGISYANYGFRLVCPPLAVR